VLTDTTVGICINLHEKLHELFLAHAFANDIAERVHKLNDQICDFLTSSRSSDPP
jgi:hypothetical protein